MYWTILNSITWWYIQLTSLHTNLRRYDSYLVEDELWVCMEFLEGTRSVT